MLMMEVVAKWVHDNCKAPEKGKFFAVKGMVAAENAPEK